MNVEGVDKKNDSLWDVAPSIFGALAYVTGYPALQFFAFLLAVSDIVQKSRLVSEASVEATSTFTRHRVTRKIKARKRKPKRRVQKVTPMLKTIRF